MSVPEEATMEARSLQPGDMVSGKGIFIGTFDLFDVHGKSLGIKTNWYDAAAEFGQPMTFNETAVMVANCNVNGRGGLHLDPACYEADLFEKLRTGEAMGNLVIAPLEVVKAIYELRNQGEYKRLGDGDFPGKLIITAGTDPARWQWTCTPYRCCPDTVQVVGFTARPGGWTPRDSLRLGGRACFAELAL